MVLKVICPKCGKIVDKNNFFGTLCRECFEKDNPQPLKLKIKSLLVCKTCGRVYSQKWVPYKQLKDILKQNLVCDFDNFYVLSTTIKEEHRHDKDFVIFTVKYYYKYKGKKVVSKLSQEIPIKYITCPRCGKIKGNYYEAIIQIRYADKPIAEVEHALKEAIRAQESKDIVVVQDKIAQKKGYDLHITFKQLAKNIIKSMKRFSPEQNTSYKLVGYDIRRGKRKYRVTYLLRFQ